MMTYLRLFFEFFKTGLFAVGGGLATLPFLYEISNNTHWYTHADVANMIAVSESTPGALGINMSTYAGYLTGGIAGGILATFSLALPSLIIIVIVARSLEKFRDNKYVNRAFFGLRPASVAMISMAGFNVAKTALINIPAWQETGALNDLFSWKAWLLAAGILLVDRKWKLNPVMQIGIAAVIGILFQF